MIYFKSCPRCYKGDVEINSDIWGLYAKCFQCGYRKDIPERAFDPKPVVVFNSRVPNPNKPAAVTVE